MHRLSDQTESPIVVGRFSRRAPAGRLCLYSGDSRRHSGDARHSTAFVGRFNAGRDRAARR